MLLVVEGPDQAERPLVKVAGYADQPLPPERGVNPRARSTIAASEDPALEPKKLSSPGSDARTMRAEGWGGL
jgi:hypothetical protein